MGETDLLQFFHNIPKMKEGESMKAGEISSKTARRMALLLLLLAGCILCLAASTLCGSVSISMHDALKALTGQEADGMQARIVTQLRLPRACEAWILGGALALSGYLLQTFFHNPIAGPFVLGISSGAKLAVALTMIFLLGRASRVSQAMLIFAAFAGAVLSFLLVLLLSGKVRSMARLVVGGVMIGYICSAVTDLVVTFADDADIVNLHNWSRGSFSGMTWEHVKASAWMVFAATLFVSLLAKPIGAYRMGEEHAAGLGVNIRLLRLYLIILSSILSGCVVAFAGPVSFVGIAVPHLVRRCLKTEAPGWMIPGAFLGGGLFCLSCDLIARVALAPVELSISTVTAIFGAPVVIWLLMDRRREE